MAYEQILTEQVGRVGILKLNRPEKLNAWTNVMRAEIHDQIEKWNADKSIGAFVITGEGRAFCAGADMGGFANDIASRDTKPAGPEVTGRVSPWVALLRHSKPSVVAFNGWAIGMGLTLMLSADVRVASENAQLSIRFVKVGIIPELASTRLLAQIVGLGHATDMCLTGRMVKADEALHMGLVSAVTPLDKLVEHAVERAKELAENPTRVVMLIKGLMWKNPLEQDLDAVVEREQIRQRISFAWPEHDEAVKAFAEKRAPRFDQLGV